MYICICAYTYSYELVFDCETYKNTYIYIYIHLPICSRTEEKSFSTCQICTILIERLIHANTASTGKTCLEQYRCWPRTVPETTISHQRVASYCHRGKDEDRTPETVSHIINRHGLPSNSEPSQERPIPILDDSCFCPRDSSRNSNLAHTRSNAKASQMSSAKNPDCKNRCNHTHTRACVTVIKHQRGQARV